MDAERFDSFARTLAGRLSRRSALRGAGAGVTASLLATVGLQTGRAAPAKQDGAAPYVVVRSYSQTGSVQDLQQALGQGYAPMLAQQSGFLEYTVIDNGSGVTSITKFASQQDEEAATNQLADWVNQNLANLLPSPDQTYSGQAFVYTINQAAICPAGPTPTAAAPTAAAPTATGVPATATATAPTATAAAPTATALPVCTDPSRPGVGCACTTGTQNPCGDTTLVCCANDANAAPGAPGTCTPDSVGCDPVGPSPTPAPTSTPCTGSGCPCTSGVEGACDDGLVCCQSGQSTPGGPGTCVAEADCGDDGPCTGVGCPCTAGVEGTCDAGLVCCQSQMNAPAEPGGPGQCATQDGCGDGGAGDDGGVAGTPTG
jgi:hypothetical protein